ncbi:MAG: hypothetical protein SFT93_03490 [Rickettsiaceae bacterium]|nr:hypothetical protein [Rickettsiaceae bacterium]
MQNNIFTKIILLLFVLSSSSSHSSASECVVFIHGYAKGGFCFVKLKNFFEENGFRAIVPEYPALQNQYNITELAETFVVPNLKKEITNCRKVHFVGFSLGGVITRYILDKHRPDNLGRVVFIASPSCGYDFLRQDLLGFFLRKTLGPVIDDLKNNSTFFERIKKPSDYEFGIISGCVSLNPFSFSHRNKCLTDGIVFYKNIQIQGAMDYVTINSSHLHILYNVATMEECYSFITTGKFRYKHQN